MSKAHFILKLSPRKNKFVLNANIKASRVYSVKKIEWTKKSHFLVKESLLKRKITIVDLNSINRNL